MSATRKSMVFLAITFALSWGVTIGGWALGAAEGRIAGFLVLAAMMTGPAVAAAICALAFEKGRRREALGLHLRPNRWWPLAYLAALALGGVSVAVTLVLTDRTLVDVGASTLAVAERAGADVSALRGNAHLSALIFAQSLLIGAAFNSVALTLTEELGWRGYLHDLWRAAGLWRASLATGLVWGVWHAPAILLFGHNYPDDREVGVVLFVLFCTLLSPLMTLVRDRGRSVVAAGILHGTINAIGGLTVLTLSSPDFPWNGLVGIGGYVALALGVGVVAWLERRRGGLQVEALADSREPASSSG
jgi:membrane protease YdiL (CAAX protease family)